MSILIYSKINMPILAKNKKALFNYEILEKLEAGIVLSGQEVKSVKNGHINLKGSYVTVQDEEAWLVNVHISPYKMAGPMTDYDPVRSRKLLLHKKEIRRILGKLSEKGLTLVPIKVYTKQGRIKVEIGIAKGKKKEDKRESIKKREQEREMRRMMKRKI